MVPSFCPVQAAPRNTMPAGNQPRRLDLQHLQKPRSARGSNLQPFAFSCNHQTVILQGLRKGQTNLAVFGSIRLGSLFLTLPTRGLTGRRVFGSGPWMTPGVAAPPRRPLHRRRSLGDRGACILYEQQSRCPAGVPDSGACSSWPRLATCRCVSPRYKRAGQGTLISSPVTSPAVPMVRGLTAGGSRIRTTGSAREWVQCCKPRTLLSTEIISLLPAMPMPCSARDRKVCRLAAGASRIRTFGPRRR